MGVRVQEFDFVFSLFGLLLGLALAEVLGGFGRALNRRPAGRIGWLTPMLGMLVMLDLISFWTTAWAVRESIPLNYLTLMLVLLFTSVYYLIATLVFPNEPDGEPDYDAHFFRQRKRILGGIAALNIVAYAVETWLSGTMFRTEQTAVNVVAFFALLAAASFVRSARAATAVLGLLVALYPMAAVIGALRDAGS